MDCHRCGTTLPTNATSCPRCDGAPARTKKLSQTDLNKTRALVPVERCENCGWLVYANDNECTACGAWINRPWKQGAVEAKPRRGQKVKASQVKNNDNAFSNEGRGGGNRVLVGIVVSLLVLVLGGLAYHFLFASRLQ